MRHTLYISRVENSKLLTPHWVYESSLCARAHYEFVPVPNERTDTATFSSPLTRHGTLRHRCPRVTCRRKQVGKCSHKPRPSRRLISPQPLRLHAAFARRRLRLVTTPKIHMLLHHLLVDVKRKVWPLCPRQSSLVRMLMASAPKLARHKVTLRWTVWLTTLSHRPAFIICNHLMELVSMVVLVSVSRYGCSNMKLLVFHFETRLRSACFPRSADDAAEFDNCTWPDVFRHHISGVNFASHLSELHHVLRLLFLDP